jgi:hypothetical protein
VREKGSDPEAIMRQPKQEIIPLRVHIKGEAYK